MSVEKLNSINLQKLKQYNYVTYTISTLEDGVWKSREYKPYEPDVWDIEFWKKLDERDGTDYDWYFPVHSHSIEGNLLDISIYDGLFRMNIDDNLVRIPVNVFDEIYDYKHFICFCYDGLDEYLELRFFNI